MVEELEEVRLNPDFTNPLRKDLEFYLPQLCSFCLYEDNSDEIARFVIIAAQSNLYFSHRVLFFLESLNSDDREINDQIKTIMLSLSQMQYAEIHQAYKETPSKQQAMKEIEDVIERYKQIEVLSEADIQAYRNKIRASDIKLKQFNFTMGVKMQLSNDGGYLSTPFFVFSLTTLCNIILHAQNKEEALFEGLQKINMHLPSAVYIPFVSQSMRNYGVLHIKVTEAKVFVTKERAPFLICVEVFRPEENKFKDKIDEIEESGGEETEQEEKGNEGIELPHRTGKFCILLMRLSYEQLEKFPEEDPCFEL